MNRTILFSALAAFALSTFGGQSPLAYSRPENGRAPGTRSPLPDKVVVERVLDGDTVVVRGIKERVRLANIDAPEMSHGYGKPGQPFSVQAARWMERKVQGKAVTLRCPEQDRYGRWICDLFLDGEYVNKELVRAGLAWANTANRRYLRDESVLEAQREAQHGHRGLWEQRRPTAPWLWRQECWLGRACAGAASLQAPSARGPFALVHKMHE
ncbi:thermonuclease family protein [Ramlibacter sp. AN1133]|uniref:thermonuclease family protein n=1 Tax=Ramlibacter sp. AN1133 TaxID=3133429 RepID=UPI0030BA68B4